MLLATCYKLQLQGEFLSSQTGQFQFFDECFLLLTSLLLGAETHWIFSRMVAKMKKKIANNKQ